MAKAGKKSPSIWVSLRGPVAKLLDRYAHDDLDGAEALVDSIKKNDNGALKAMKRILVDVSFLGGVSFKSPIAWHAAAHGKFGWSEFLLRLDDSAWLQALALACGEADGACVSKMLELGASRTDSPWKYAVSLCTAELAACHGGLSQSMIAKSMSVNIASKYDKGMDMDSRMEMEMAKRLLQVNSSVNVRLSPIAIAMAAGNEGAVHALLGAVSFAGSDANSKYSMEEQERDADCLGILKGLRGVFAAMEKAGVLHQAERFMPAVDEAMEKISLSASRRIDALDLERAFSHGFTAPDYAEVKRILEKGCADNVQLLNPKGQGRDAPLSMAAKSKGPFRAKWVSLLAENGAVAGARSALVELAPLSDGDSSAAVKSLLGTGVDPWDMAEKDAGTFRLDKDVLCMACNGGALDNVAAIGRRAAELAEGGSRAAKLALSECLTMLRRQAERDEGAGVRSDNKLAILHQMEHFNAVGSGESMPPAVDKEAMGRPSLEAPAGFDALLMRELERLRMENAYLKEKLKERAPGFSRLAGTERPERAKPIVDKLAVRRQAAEDPEIPESPGAARRA